MFFCLSFLHSCFFFTFFLLRCVVECEWTDYQSQAMWVVNPFRDPEPLPVLNPSYFVPKNGFSVVKGLRKRFFMYGTVCALWGAGHD